MATSLTNTGIAFPDSTTQTTAATGFDSGTRMMFAQTSAPTGWTKDTTNYNEHALRVVTGTAGTGGSSNFTTAFGTPSVTGSLSGTVGSTTLTTSTIPAHNHSISTKKGATSLGQAVGYNGDSTAVTAYTNNTGSGNSHNHSFSGSLSSASASISVKYLDVITATKD